MQQNSEFLQTLSQETATLAERTAQSVVGIDTGTRMPGSGFVWREHLVVTSESVLPDVDEVGVRLPDGGQIKGKIAARDPGTDVALIEVAGLNAPSIHMNADATVTPGHFLLVVGRSLKNGVTATAGICSLAGGVWQTWRGGRIDQLLRMDLRLHSGASGASVVRYDGALVGLASAGLSRSSPIAVPTATLRRVVEELAATGRVKRGYLGVSLQPITLPENLVESNELRTKTGLMVLSVEKGSPAEKGDLGLGDIVVAVDGAPIKNHRDVQAALDSRGVGAELAIKILRGGKLQQTTVVLGERERRR